MRKVWASQICRMRSRVKVETLRDALKRHTERASLKIASSRGFPLRTCSIITETTCSRCRFFALIAATRAAAFATITFRGYSLPPLAASSLRSSSMPYLLIARV